MAAISTYLVDKLLDCLANASGFNVGSVYIQLHTGDPGSAGTANVATNNTRKSVAFAAASAEQKASNADLTWASVPATETYAYVSLWDAATGGNFLWAGALTAAKSVNAGDTFTIPSGSLTVAIS